jgi:hypothetical protein
MGGKLMTPFNGNYISSDGTVKNFMNIGDAPPDHIINQMTPLNGWFYASDGSLHNFDELGGGESGGGGTSIHSELIGREEPNQHPIEAISGLKNAIYNPNILHNWDFRNPVNQRGLTEYTGGLTYTIDRWRHVWNIKTNIMSGFIRLTCTAAIGDLAQHIENGHLFNGSKLTFTIMLTTGETVSHTVTVPTGDFTSESPRHGNLSLFVSRNSVGAFAGLLTVRVLVYGTNEYVDLIATKLETGTVSTLANDPPMDFGRELIVCQRYYEKSYNYMYAPGSMTVLGVVRGIAMPHSFETIRGTSFKVSKRINPTLQIYSENGTLNRVSSQFGSDVISHNVIGWRVSQNDISFITLDNPYDLDMIANYHFIADAEL